MHSRRAAAFFLGVWLGSAVFMAWVALENLRAPRRFIDHASAGALAALGSLDRDAAQQLLRYQAAQQNRALFQDWGAVQLILGIAFFLYLLFGSREKMMSLSLVLGMVLAVVAQLFLVTPQILSAERVFASSGGASVRAFYGGYSALEVVKWCCGLFLAGRFVLRGSGRSGDARDRFDVVNKADHRHVNR